MICASCGADELKPDVRDIKQTYKGRINIIKDVHADWCDSCGEAELDAGDGPEGKEADRVSDEMGAFIDKVKAEMTDAEFIQTVRENLGLKKKKRRFFSAAVTTDSRGMKAARRYRLLPWCCCFGCWTSIPNCWTRFFTRMTCLNRVHPKWTSANAIAWVAVKTIPSP